MVQWEVKGREYANCNCSYGCPCQFNALPTNGHCQAAAGFEIEEGHFGDVRLDGLRAAMVVKWPKAVHEGNGTMQIVIDERADEKQREALRKIMTGEETREMGTMWWVFSMMSPNKPPPLFKPIEFEVDVEQRRARLSVPGVIESSAKPIVNPVTGAQHRVRIDMPDGFEYRLAEIGSGSTRTYGEVELELNDSYSQFARIHFTQDGVVA